MENICDDDGKVKFYTGFTTFSALMICFNLLGPSVDNLTYRSTGREVKSKKGQKRKLSPINELFLLLVQLRLGLFEQDLAHRFGISQSSVSRVYTNKMDRLCVFTFEASSFMGPKPLIFSNMSNVFKVLYPTTRVIIDATEIFVERPALPELQQLTY